MHLMLEENIAFDILRLLHPDFLVWMGSICCCRKQCGTTAADIFYYEFKAMDRLDNQEAHNRKEPTDTSVVTLAFRFSR